MLQLLKMLFYHFRGKKYYKNELTVYGKPKVTPISTSDVVKENDPVHLTAHRGFSGIAPENTLPAFELACKENFFAIECDVNLTKDKKWIINHNPSIDHTCDGSGKISKLTLEELRKFKINFGNGLENYKNLKLPTLDEYLDICKKYNAIPEIEVKIGGSNNHLSEIVDKLKEKDLLNKAIIISFDIRKLIKLQKYSPNTKFWYLSEGIDNYGVKNCKKYGFRYAVSASNSNAAIKATLDKGIEMAVWTVDRIERLNELYALGIRYITTNFITP